MSDDIIQADEEKLKLSSTLHPCSLSLRIKNFLDAKEYTRFIKNVERTVRSSSEYRHWRDYITEVLQINSCSISKETRDDCSLEVHHHIPSLFVLIKTIINNRISKNISFCTFDICTECIELHFKNKIGFVPLIGSLHEKFHNGKLEIPAPMIMGDYKWLLDNYVFDADDLSTIQARLKVEEVTGCDWRNGKYPGIEDSKTFPDHLQLIER